jgi:hypothetical protein
MAEKPLKIICEKDCFQNAVYWRAGTIRVLPPGSPIPYHFREYDPDEALMEVDLPEFSKQELKDVGIATADGKTRPRPIGVKQA